MLVKRYLVKEMPEAVAMIREDLGKDAVILSTKKIQSRGFLGMFAKTQIEVVAAANEAEAKPAAPAKQPVLQPIPGVARNVAMGAYQQHSATPAPQASAETPSPVPEPPAFEPAVFPKIRQADVTPAPVPKPERQAAVTVAKADNSQLLSEVQELRTLVRTLVNSSSHQMLPEPVLAVRKHLLAQDMEEELVNELVEKGILQFNQVHDINEQEFRGILTNFIKEELEKLAPPSMLASTTRVASLIGPTGVGKTTTIAKLAAEQVLQKGKKVGLITTDTYRIAAVEQLRTYANILGVSLEVCHSPDDIRRAMERFQDCDLILADTAGRNYGNMLNVRELNSYLQVLEPDETFLVLSLTTKASDLDRIVNNFSEVEIDKLLFTKSDETSTYGAVYNLVVRHRLPLSYLTTGQNVPDDIEALSTEILARLLVGEKTDV